MKRLRGDLRCDEGGKDTDENNAGNDIAQIQRHRHGIAPGFAKRRRKDFDHPEGQSDFRDLARTDRKAYLCYLMKVQPAASSTPAFTQLYLPKDHCKKSILR
jgi:hypothetical protein